jgi:benzoyl-CoA reductase/2-hydroxyglutaryl-CoA dehydratase subunit BcrC/BadD/HgdB
MRKSKSEKVNAEVDEEGGENAILEAAMLICRRLRDELEEEIKEMQEEIKAAKKDGEGDSDLTDIIEKRISKQWDWWQNCEDAQDALRKMLGKEKE